MHDGFRLLVQGLLGLGVIGDGFEGIDDGLGGWVGELRIGIEGFASRSGASRTTPRRGAFLGFWIRVWGLGFGV